MMRLKLIYLTTLWIFCGNSGKERRLQGHRSVTNIVKKTKTETRHDLLKVFISKLDSLARHQYNWLHQAEQCRCLRDPRGSYTPHGLFSYACKLATEVQAFHFGGSQRQAAMMSVLPGFTMSQYLKIWGSKILQSPHCISWVTAQWHGTECLTCLFTSLPLWTLIAWS